MGEVGAGLSPVLFWVKVTGNLVNDFNYVSLTPVSAWTLEPGRPSSMFSGCVSWRSPLFEPQFPHQQSGGDK